jgi:hypothetical protein
MPRAMGRDQTVGVKSAMAKKRARKRQVWNKGLEVGKRDGFTPAQVKRIRGLLADRGVPGLRDLALFSTAMTRSTCAGSPSSWWTILLMRTSSGQAPDARSARSVSTKPKRRWLHDRQRLACCRRLRYLRFSNAFHVIVASISAMRPQDEGG